MIEKARQLQAQDRRLMLRLIAGEVALVRIWRTPTFAMFWVSGSCAPDLCRTDEQKAKRMDTSGDFISMCDQDVLLLENIVTGDET